MGKKEIVLFLVNLVIEKLSAEDLKKWMDMGLDKLEEKIIESPNKWDDTVGLPFIKLARAAFSLED